MFNNHFYMRKIILSLILVSVAFSAQAQLAPGTMFIGLDGGFESTNNVLGSADEKFTSGQVIPQIGYFVGENFALGLGIGFGGFEDEAANGDIDKTTFFTIEPFGRYYTMLSDNFGIYGELRIQYRSASSEFTDGTTGDVTEDPSIDQFGATISPGLIFFPGEQFGIEFQFGALGYTSTDYNTADDESTFTANLNPFRNSRIGFQWYFNR